MWFLEQLEPNSAAHRVPLALHLTGALDRGALGAALDAVIARHEALRSTFPTDEGLPTLRVAPPAPVELPVVDLGAVPRLEQLREAAAQVERLSQRPMEVGTGPLVRAVLIRLADDEHVLGIVVHHLVCDGWSRGIIRNDLAAAYAAAIKGASRLLPPAPLAASLLAEAHRRALDDGRLDDLIEAWRSRLEPLPPLVELPPDRNTLATGAGSTVQLDVPAAHTGPLHELAKAESATLFMVLLAAFAATLQRHGGHDDLIVGVPVAGRTVAQSEQVVGLLMNTLPVRLDLSGEPSATELLGRVRQATLAAYAGQQVPLERLVEVLRPERRLGQRPLTQVMFQLRNLPPVATDMGGLVVEDLSVHSRP
jgi:hypothetical protein